MVDKPKTVLSLATLLEPLKKYNINKTIDLATATYSTTLIKH